MVRDTAPWVEYATFLFSPIFSCLPVKACHTRSCGRGRAPSQTSHTTGDQRRTSIHQDLEVTLTRRSTGVPGQLGGVWPRGAELLKGTRYPRPTACTKVVTHCTRNSAVGSRDALERRRQLFGGMHLPQSASQTFEWMQVRPISYNSQLGAVPVKILSLLCSLCIID